MLQFVSVFVEVIQQTPGLSFVDVETGELLQSSSMMALFDDTWNDANTAPVGQQPGAEFVDVEAEIVESSRALSQSMSVIEPENFLADQLGPQRAVPTVKLIAHFEGGKPTIVEASSGVEIQHFTAEVVHGQGKVMGSLAVGQPGVTKGGGLGIDEIGGQ